VRGVGQVVVAAEQQSAVTVQVDPQQLAALGTGLDQVSTALTDATLDMPKGNLEGPRAEYPLDADDQLFEAAQFRKVIVAYHDGAPVRLGELGRVINSSENPRTGSWFGTTPCELLLLELQPGANEIRGVDSIKTMLPRLEQSIPRSVRVDLVADRSAEIRTSVADVEFTLLLTAGLVVLTILAFLQKPSATIIPSITLPVVIIATFSGMYFLGYSIDNLSLMVLTIAVGFLVDDAIIIIENIARYIEAGYRPLQVALKGSAQIAFTIVSMTLSLIAVFIPLLFMSGVVGLMFHEFAVTVTLTLLFSALVSLTLTPMMCPQFERRKRPRLRWADDLPARVRAVATSL
jgi:multidrug efflux pump subunit AcrB